MRKYYVSLILKVKFVREIGANGIRTLDKRGLLYHANKLISCICNTGIEVWEEDKYYNTQVKQNSSKCQKGSAPGRWVG